MIICSDSSSAGKRVSDPGTLAQFFDDLAKKLGLKEEQIKLLGRVVRGNWVRFLTKTSKSHRLHLKYFFSLQLSLQYSIWL